MKGRKKIFGQWSNAVYLRIWFTNTNTDLGEFLALSIFWKKVVVVVVGILSSKHMFENRFVYIMYLVVLVMGEKKLFDMLSGRATSSMKRNSFLCHLSFI